MKKLILALFFGVLVYSFQPFIGSALSNLTFVKSLDYTNFNYKHKMETVLGDRMVMFAEDGLLSIIGPLSGSPIVESHAPENVIAFSRMPNDYVLAAVMSTTTQGDVFLNLYKVNSLSNLILKSSLQIAFAEENIFTADIVSKGSTAYLLGMREGKSYISVIDVVGETIVVKKDIILAKESGSAIVEGVIKGNLLYAISSYVDNRFYIFDISSNGVPKKVGEVEVLAPGRLAVSPNNTFAYVLTTSVAGLTGGGAVDRIYSINVSQANNPTIATTVDFAQGQRKGGITADNQYVYVLSQADSSGDQNIERYSTHVKKGLSGLISITEASSTEGALYSDILVEGNNVYLSLLKKFSIFSK